MLDKKTIQAINNLFKDKKCCVCGEQAERLTKKEYLCLKHFLREPDRKRDYVVYHSCKFFDKRTLLQEEIG